MQKITPFLWFDRNAEEAITFYTSTFANSHIHHVQRYPDGPMKDQVLTGVFGLMGQQFMALDGGPKFHFTPAVSFFVDCASEADIDATWAKLSEGATILMPLQAYPFSAKFGWLSDRFGISWQISLSDTQRISPFLTFVGPQHGKAEEAIRYYVSLFENSTVDAITYYAEGQGGEPGKVQLARFQLHGQAFLASENHYDHEWNFNESISLFVNCDSQDEVDRLWNSLSAVPEAEQCGWLKDKYGVSWQIIPSALPRLMSNPDPEKAGRVMQAILQMKKIDIATLENA